MNFPEDFIKRIKSQEYIDPEALLEALENPSPVSIRINQLKWKKRPLFSRPVPWCADGFYLEKRPSFTLDPLFHAGCYYPQEASGMFLEQVFGKIVDSHVNLKVLDLCGAPGGKSTHISSLIGPGGFLVANDVIKSRANVLAANMIRWGTSNTIVTQNDPSDFAKLSGFFDVVLVDAPCSGEGMFRDPVAIREWSPENTTHCSERQKRILMDVWPSIKDEGFLIYSTCTFNPGENERNIKWLLDKHEGEIITLDISYYKGITEIKYAGINGYGFYPDKIEGEGLFIIVVKKKEKSINKLINIKSKIDIKLHKEDIKSVSRLTNVNEKNLIKFGNDIFKIPGEINDYQFIKQNLRIIHPGTKLFTLKSRDYLPSHDLALSCELKNDAFPVADLDYNQAIAYLRRENIKIESGMEGWFLVACHGANLGFAKNIGNRINNYYPLNWRIRMRSSEDDQGRLIKWD